jgi:hypothetical protein
MAGTNVAQPEAGEICEYDQKAEHSQEQEQGEEKQACEHAKRGFQAAEVRRDFAADGLSGIEQRHSIFDGLNWL